MGNHQTVSEWTSITHELYYAMEQLTFSFRHSLEKFVYSIYILYRYIKLHISNREKGKRFLDKKAQKICEVSYALSITRKHENNLTSFSLEGSFKHFCWPFCCCYVLLSSVHFLLLLLFY